MTPLLPWWLAGLLAGAALIAGRALGAWARRDPRRAAWPREARAVGLLALLVAGFFWRPLFTPGVWLPIGGGDLASFFYPLYSFIYRSIQAGQIPLWNPYAFGGMPLAADVQSGLFYPPNLLAWFTLPSYDYGTLEWLLVAHYAWATLGMYVWLRDGRLLRPAAVAGAAAFAFCGFMTAHFGHMPMIFTAAWLPWNLFLARRAATRANPGWVALAGLALGCTFLAGHPQTTLYEGLALALYWLFLLGQADRGGRAGAGGDLPPTVQSGALSYNFDRFAAALRAPHSVIRMQLGRLLLIGLIAAGLSAMLFLPAQELAGQSLRAAITYEEASTHSMQPVGLLTLILPRVFGANPLAYWVPWQSTENWGYLGAIALLVAVLGLGLRRDRRQAFPLALGLLALLGMLGPFSIVFSWLHGLVPGFDHFRAAGRFLLLLGLASAALAALGLDTLLRVLPAVGRDEGSGIRDQGSGETDAAAVGQSSALDGGPAAPPTPAVREPRWGATLLDAAAPGPAQTRRLRALTLGLTGSVAWLVLGLIPLATAIFLAGYAIDHAQSVLNDLYALAVWLGLAAALLWAALRGRLGGRLVALALAVLLVLDLFSPNSHFNPTSTDILAAYVQPAAVDFLRAQTGPPAYARIDSDTDVGPVWQPLLGTLAGIADAGGLYNPLELGRYAAYWDLAKAHRNSVLYDLLGVKYTLALSPTLIADPKFTRATTGASNLLAGTNAHADPRLFVVHDARVEPDDTAALGKLLNGTVLGWHTIYVADGPAGQSKTPSTLEAGNPGEGATITAYTPNAITAHLDLREPGWAVFSEVWYPGWEAMVDGQVQPDAVQRADTIFRAVHLSAGAHTVVLRFASAPLTTGLWISLGTLLLTMLGGLVAWMQSRRRQPGTDPGGQA